MNLLTRTYLNKILSKLVLLLILAAPGHFASAKSVKEAEPVKIAQQVIIAEPAKVAEPITTASENQPAADPLLISALKTAASAAHSFDNVYDAEVWLVAKDRPLAKIIKDPQQRINLLKLIHAEASLAQLKPEIVLALIEVESRFDSYAVSSAGAMGMMQIMPFWKKEIGRSDDNLMDIQTNLRYGCTILRYYLDKEKGRLADALARYNGSYGEYWYAERVLDAWAKNWR
jgi:soluble lytic murein transglycosylase-like protein